MFLVALVNTRLIVVKADSGLQAAVTRSFQSSDSERSVRRLLAAFPFRIRNCHQSVCLGALSFVRGLSLSSRPLLQCPNGPRCSIHLDCASAPDGRGDWNSDIGSSYRSLDTPGVAVPYEAPRRLTTRCPSPLNAAGSLFLCGHCSSW